MRITTIIAALSAGVLCLGGAQAAEVTIDFTTPNVLIDSGTYSEDGFIVDGSGTTAGEIENNRLREGAFVGTDVFTITRDGGGEFQFLAFDYGSDDEGFLSDAFQLFGYSGGMQVADFGLYATSSGTLLTVMLMNAILIDELRIVATGSLNERTPVWDNFVFNTASEVPLPAAAPLFLAGLAGFGWTRRKRANAAA